MKETYHIYVDGSNLGGATGYGVVILKDGELIEELSGSVPDALTQGTRQIAGELFAVERAIMWCQENGIREVSIFYDCEGIEKWASGEWKTNHPLTRRYAELVRNSGILIHWHKVNSHTKDCWNERADELAKIGTGFLTHKTEGELVSELENKAKGFVGFLESHGFKAKLKGIYNHNCAKIEISENDRVIGYINIYHTKRIAFSAKYHELKDSSYEGRLDLLWQEYIQGYDRFLV